MNKENNCSHTQSNMSLKMTALRLFLLQADRRPLVAGHRAQRAEWNCVECTDSGSPRTPGHAAPSHPEPLHTHLSLLFSSMVFSLTSITLSPPSWLRSPSSLLASHYSMGAFPGMQDALAGSSLVLRPLRLFLVPLVPSCRVPLQPTCLLLSCVFSASWEFRASHGNALLLSN